jgi:peptidyl-prolyl cis-trans isomerase SurA
MRKILFSLFLSTIMSIGNASNNSSASKNLVELNTIVAVVNETPILKSTLDQRINMVQRQLNARHIALPPNDILQTQVLNQIIEEEVQLQLADSRHIEIASYQLNQQLQRIAAEQKVTLPELYQQAEQDGFTRDSYEQQLKDQMRIHELIQTTLASKIVITQKDVDLYRNSQLAHATAGKEYQVENIVIPLDASPTVEQVKAAEAKASALLTQIKNGKVAFDQAAVSNSSGQSNLQGGDLGFRSIAELPEIFAQAIANMQVGEVAGPIRAGNGIQLIKLVAVKNNLQELTDEQIRQALFKRKIEEAYPIWLASVESQAYIYKI